MSVDPLAEKYAYQSVYSFSSNQPVHAPELEGLESMNDLYQREYTAEEEEVGAMIAGTVNSVRASVANLANRGISAVTGMEVTEQMVVNDDGSLSIVKNMPAEGTGEQIVNSAMDIVTIALAVAGGPEGTLMANAGKAPLIDAVGDAKKSSLYENVTNKSKNGGIPTTKNRATDVTKTEFEGNLQKSGYEKTPISDKVNKFEKDGKSYTTRPDKGGGVSADYRKNTDSKNP